MPGSILVPSIVPSWTSRPVSDPSRMSRLVSDPSEHWTKQIVRGDLDWRWEGVVHEHLVSDAERSSRRLAGAAVHTWNVGAARTGRWHRDRELLEAHLERAPQDARARFYLAQTHRELGEPRRAIEHYRRRALLGGWAEEVYYSRLQIGGSAPSWATGPRRWTRCATRGRCARGAWRPPTSWRAACACGGATARRTGSRRWRPP
ncbi:MAG: tetratricopeptide repeat protein [Solirubrobacteraceae bacterium]